MIVQEQMEGGIIRTYSNSGVKIHGGFPEANYDIAYDPEEAGRVYTETDIPLDKPIPEYIGGPKQYSKLKILLAARDAGFVDQLVEFIEGNKTIELIWNASNTIEDNELLGDYLPLIAQALGKDESAIRAFLDEYCVVD